MVEGQVHVDNARMPPIDSLPVVHTLPQEAVKEGKTYGLGLGGCHLGPDGRNFFVGLDAIDVIEVIYNDVKEPFPESVIEV